MIRLRGRFECFLMISLGIKSYVLREMRGVSCRLDSPPCFYGARHLCGLAGLEGLDNLYKMLFGDVKRGLGVERLAGVSSDRAGFRGREGATKQDKGLGEGNGENARQSTYTTKPETD